MKNRKQKIDVQKAILTTVAVAGVLAVGIVAPNAVSLILKLGKKPHKRQSEVLRQTQKKLVARGYLAYSGGFVRLTAKGENELRAMELRDFQIKKPKRWDGKWRMLIFDITEKRRRVRDRLRDTLQRVGFMHLQDSVWLYPYDCQELVALLKADFKIGKAMLYVVVDELEGDGVFREYFGLLH